MGLEIPGGPKTAPGHKGLGLAPQGLQSFRPLPKERMARRQRCE